MKGSRPPKYRTDPGLEGEFEPGSHGKVLRNKLGIRTIPEMDQAEYNALEDAQERYLDVVTDKTVFTAQFIRDMHRDWMGGIYEWAGSYRTVEMSKGGFTWPPASRVETNMDRFEATILAPRTPMRKSSARGAVEDLAIIHAELLLIHPFREGNGRLARWLAELMCLQSGLPLPDFGFDVPGNEAVHARYLRAVTQGYEQDYRALADFFLEALERRTAG
ncbi:MAG: Fic/DOC family protein [Oceanipulchritudo sp.]